LRELLAAARKDSSTSSKPPSSDLVKPKPTQDANATKRSLGGQPGHPKHERAPFPPEQVSHFEEHTLAVCPCCGGSLRRNGQVAKVVQQVDIEKPPLVIEQHTSPEYWCEQCQKPYQAPMPLHLDKGGLVGLELTALIAFMKGACHASFSTIRTFLRDVVGVTISRGELSKILGKVSQALDKPYEELLLLLPQEAIVNAEETGHKCQGERWWTWCFRAELYTLYHLDAYRSADVLRDLLGTEFKGVLGCDYFSAYRR
jgi:transposase